MAKGQKAAIVALGCMLLGILVMGALVVGVVWMLLTERKPPIRPPTIETPAPTPKSPPSTSQPATPPSVASTAPVASAAPSATGASDLPPGVHDLVRPFPSQRYDREIWTTLVVDDLHKVDPQVIYPHAKRLAQVLSPKARLTCMGPFTVYQELVAGTVDLSQKGNFVTYSFQADEIDSTKPPGKDQIRRDIEVRAEAGRVEGSLRTTAKKRFPECKPFREPTCPVVRAWSTAVSSGVPSNAVAKLILTERWPPRSSDRMVWSFRVEGHNEYRREIDAETCALVKSWAAHK